MFEALIEKLIERDYKSGKKCKDCPVFFSVGYLKEPLGLCFLRKAITSGDNPVCTHYKYFEEESK